MPRTAWRRSLVLMATLLFGVAAADAGAQSPGGAFTVAPHAGYFMFDEASGLDDYATAGVDVAYHLNTYFSIGLFGDIARPTTIGKYFPRARHEFEDTTFTYRVSQQVTLANVGVAGWVSYPVGPMAASLVAGVGRYTIFMDPQVMRRSESFGGLGFVVGGTLGYALSDNTGLQLSVRDYYFTDYERRALDPVLEPHVDDTWPEFLEGVPPRKERFHNLRVSVGLTFVPGGNR